MTTTGTIVWTVVDPTETTYGHHSTLVVDYGVVDAKGRKCGGYASVGRSYHLGGYWVSVHATRDGKHFGASSRSTRVATLAGAKAVGEKKLAEAAKRFKRAAEKGVGRQWGGAS